MEPCGFRVGLLHVIPASRYNCVLTCKFQWQKTQNEQKKQGEDGPREMQNKERNEEEENVCTCEAFCNCQRERTTNKGNEAVLATFRDTKLTSAGWNRVFPLPVVLTLVVAAAHQGVSGVASVLHNRVVIVPGRLSGNTSVGRLSREPTCHPCKNPHRESSERDNLRRGTRALHQTQTLSLCFKFCAGGNQLLCNLACD